MIPQPASIQLRPDFARQLKRVARAQASREGNRAWVERSRSVGRPRPAPWLFTRTCLLLATVGLLKLGLVASVGEAAYLDRVARLEQGGWSERMAAWVIQADPVTFAVRDDLARFTREVVPAL